MGGLCPGGAKREEDTEFRSKSLGFSGKLKAKKSFAKQEDDHYLHSDVDVSGRTPPIYDSGELSSISRELKPSTPARRGDNKAPHMSSFLGRAGNVGLEVLDTLGSSMSNLNPSSGFLSGVASRGNCISILAFEVANTIVKGSNLLQSLSEENIQFLKKEILHSEGVQLLVSTDMKELLSIAAADKREEFGVFSREVVRFGDLCKDPQWHNLGRFFSKLDQDHAIEKQVREEAETTMQELATLAEHTSELYHELHALDRFEQDYRRKLEEVDSLHLPRRGESLTMLQSELKQQKKLVRSLKKKSLWSKNLEEVVEKLVDIVTFIHQDILDAFGDDAMAQVRKEPSQRLGGAGLALHYANIINQIDNIASRPTCLPPNTRDTLYQGLPANVKSALRFRLQAIDSKEELTVAQVKDEMEKSLQWLVPVAANTTKAHQGFGWVGEWANTGTEFGKKSATPNNLIRLQTLFHADKQKLDLYILELVTWLHHLISVVRQRDYIFKPPPARSPSSNMQRLPSMNYSTKSFKVQLSQGDKDLLEDVCWNRLVPGVSKSQEFEKGCKVWPLSRSAGSSPNRDGLDTTF